MEPYLPKLTEPVRRWLRFAGLLVVVGLLCWMLYVLRTVFTPLLAALAIAYTVNPLVTALEQTGKVQRLTVVIVVFVLLGALLVGGGLYVGSKTVVELEQLGQQLPEYLQRAEQWLSARAHEAARKLAAPDGAAQAPLPAASAPAAPAAGRPSDWWRFALPLLQEYGAGLARSTANYLGSVMSSVASLVSLLILVPMYTFFFLWRFNDIVHVIRVHLPAAYRDAVVHVAATIDAAVASFFRGRLIVCLIVGTVGGIGWSLVGVPYSLPLGLLLGVLNLVPFLSLLALPPALLLTFMRASEAGTSWAWPVSLAMAVYMGVQGLEAFVLGPYVVGRSSGLHPLTVVVALLIGAQLGGLLGLLLAIPLASTFRTLAAQWLLPEIRRLAGQPAPSPEDVRP